MQSLGLSSSPFDGPDTLGDPGSENRSGTESGTGNRTGSPGGDPPPPERRRPAFPGGLGSGWRRRLTLAGVLLLVVLGTIRLLRGSARSVDPGYAGIAVGRVNGSVELLPAGTHFRPPALYDLHVVRISDQLLTGPEGSFSVSTKEGVAANVTIQARWALDRASLLRKWSALPARPGPELVSPVVAAAFRALAPRYEVASLISDKREEFAAIAAKQARERLAESGIVLKEVLISDLTLPADFERGREAMVDEIQKTERMEVTLKLKAKEVEQTRLEAEAQKARVVQQAEAAAQQRVIQAKGESDAMKFILEQKHKEIDQKKLEAQADRETRVQRAQSEAEASKISAEAEASHRRTMADAEAYAIRKTSEAQFENLKREAELVSANPLLIPKTFADRISDKVQVILTPTLGGETFTDEVVRRAARQGAGETEAPATGATKTASKSH